MTTITDPPQPNAGTLTCTDAPHWCPLPCHTALGDIVGCLWRAFESLRQNELCHIVCQCLLAANLTGHTEKVGVENFELLKVLGTGGERDLLFCMGVLNGQYACGWFDTLCVIIYSWPVLYLFRGLSVFRPHHCIRILVLPDISVPVKQYKCSMSLCMNETRPGYYMASTGKSTNVT